MLSSEVAQSLTSYGHFSDLGVERSLLVTAMLIFSCKANTSIHGLREDDTAIFWEGGVDSEPLAYRCLKGVYILGGRVGFRECPRLQLKEGILWEGGVDYGSVAYSGEEWRYILEGGVDSESVAYLGGGGYIGRAG